MAMLTNSQWQPRPWLIPLALVSVLPTVALWAAALADALGFTHLLRVLPVPATATSRPERLLLLAIFLGVMLVLPAVGAIAAVLGTVAIEVRIFEWEVSARLRLPRPPWTTGQLLAVALVVIGGILFCAMTGHLAADCVFGNDCGFS